MKDKQTRATLLQWLIPIGTLLFIVVVMVVTFTNKITQETYTEIENGLLETAGRRASDFSNDINVMNGSGISVGEMLTNLEDCDMSEARSAIAALKASTPAYLVAITGTDGKGIDSDGKAVDIGKEEYFKDKSIDTAKCVYAKEEPMGGEPALVTFVPLKKQETTEGYIELYYPMKRIETFFQGMEYGSRVVYLMMLEDGTVINRQGAKSAFVRESNFGSCIEKGSVYDGDGPTTMRRLTRHASGTIGIAYADEERTFAYVPLGINEWHLAIGMEKSQIEGLVSRQIRQTESIIWKIILAVGLCLALIAVMNIMNKLLFNEKNRILENKADSDLLTELHNKIATERKIKEYMTLNSGKQALMFVLDIDNFKKINDTMGHAFGDEVLRALGIRLKAEFRVTDVIGRTGGDEFMLFIKDLREEDMIAREAGRITQIFANFKVGEYVKYSATASIGAAVYPRDAESFEDLYKAADKALYMAKKRGKNQLAFYNQDAANIDLEKEQKKGRE